MIALALALALSQGAWGAPPASFSAEAFDSLQSAGRIVLLQFTSAECDACREQEESLDRIGKDPVDPAPALLKVNFDREASLRARYSVSAVSTLLLFKGSLEIGRAQGLGTEEEVRDFIRLSLERTRGRPKLRPKRDFRPKR